MKALTPDIQSESGRLRSVVLGRADDMGPVPSIEDCYDPKSRESVIKGTYPHESDLIAEMAAFAEVLEKYDVRVVRPTPLVGYQQVFARDVCFVLENKFIVPNIIEDREDELDGLSEVIQNIASEDIIRLRDGVFAEGGDCMPWRDFIFVGCSPQDEYEQYTTARTNELAAKRLQELFPDKKVKTFNLIKDDLDPRIGILHLDCCFQPIGRGEAIIYPGGFRHEADVAFIKSLFGEDNLIEVSQDEFYNMFPNIFSIDEKTVVSNASFTRLNAELRQRGYTVEEIKYDEVSKMGGLLRCSTMPIRRDPIT